MKIFLEDVSFEEKDIVKSLGAKWNPVKKKWYIEDPEDLKPFLNWLPSVYGFYGIKKLTANKSVSGKPRRNRLDKKQWEKKKNADMKKRPKEYSFLNSDGLVQCKSYIFKLGDDIEVYHFGLWRTAKLVTDGKSFFTSLGTEAINQRIRPVKQS